MATIMTARRTVLIIGCTTGVGVMYYYLVARRRKEREKKKKNTWAMPEGVSTTDVSKPQKIEDALGLTKEDTFFASTPAHEDTVALRGIVASSQKLASLAGVEILEKGGTAIDAAVAMASVLCVTEPGSTDLGGDCFFLLYDPSKRIIGINGSGRASRFATIEAVRAMVKDPNNQTIEPAMRNGLNVTTPGCVAAWCDALDRYGVLSYRQVFAPAERLAREGFAMETKAFRAVRACAENDATFLKTILSFDDDDDDDDDSRVARRPEMAQVLREISDNGKHAFYRGRTAREIADVVGQFGGLLDAEDLKSHETTFTKPISTAFRGFRIWEHAPNGAGVVALVALNIISALGGVDDWTPGVEEARSLHVLIEALRWAFFVCRAAVGGDTSRETVSKLLSSERARELAALIDLDKASAVDKIKEASLSGSSRGLVGAPLGPCDTVSFQVVDAQGRAVSAVNSTYMSFGSRIAARGFSLHNRGHNFALVDGHPNSIAPNKRPYHTIIPCLVTRESDGSLFATLTNMGGFMQPQGHVQHVINLLVRRLGPQASVAAPRFCVPNAESVASTANNSGSSKRFGGMADYVALEPGFDAATRTALADVFGHDVRLLSTDAFLAAQVTGKAQIIVLDHDKKHQAGGGTKGPVVKRAGSDPRADGTALATL